VAAWLGIVNVLPAAEPDRLIDQLWNQGVVFDQTQAIPLPRPTLADGLDPAAQQQALARVADETHPLEALTRKSVVAPFVLKISDEKPLGGALPRRVDLWFVAYGDLKVIADESFLKGQIDAGSKGDQGGFLSDQDLQSRNITPEKDQRFLAGAVTLFDRVRISGVMRTQLTRSDESATVAAVLDPRFDKDARFPNGWQPATRDDNGKVQFGETHLYHSAAWYCKATKLVQPAGAVLVEYHLLFDEPHAWFNGANLLRSKLPILVQDGVRKFRRRLEGQGSQ
jgi:hypothetical protein